MTRLRTKTDALTSKAEDIMIEVNIAKLQGKIQRNEVSNWLKEVKSIEEQVSNIEKKLEEQNRCWDGSMPNYHLRRKISKMSLKLIIQADELISNGNFEKVAFEQQAVLSCTMATTSIASKTTTDVTLEEILHCILNTKIRIIGVHGMGGVGKTSIMTNINNRLNKTKDFDDIIWITVSKDVDVNKLQRKIAKKLKIDLKEGEDDDDTKTKIFSALERRKKFLLIFDDMWDDFPLDKIGIPHPSEENGCKIVLTTRDLRVCRAMGAHEVKVKVLSDEESWELFKKNAGDVVLSTGVEELAKAVTRECCYLPLAIITVGKAMCGVNEIRVWKNALKELQESNLEVKGMDDVFVQLKFSYTRLRNSELKSCFLYCSLYPEDHEIHCQRLIEYWICEGIIDKRETRDDNMNKGHAILDELTKVSLLEVVRGAGDHKVVRMHDLIRDMAIRITRMESPRSMINAGVQLKESPTEWPTDAERISLMLNDIKVFSGQPNCHHLLTLLLQENPLEKIIPHSYFNHMCSLRVLDLSWTRIKALPKSISNLKNLRALLLWNCEFLKEVPSLSNLEELRVLDLSYTNIRELPSGMEAMVKLQCLNLDSTKELRLFPTGIIPRLSFLEELRMYQSGWKWSSMTTEGARIKEIVNSTRLATLVIDFMDLSSFLYHVNSGNWQMMKSFRLCVGSSTCPYYKSRFSVQINRCNLIGEDNSLYLPYKTRWLQINSCEFISLWKYTQQINTSELCGCVLYSCKKMEFLMADEEPLLPDLKELTMEDMPDLLALCKGIPSLDALKSLESLKVTSCFKLKCLLPPRLLQQLRRLKRIDVRYCSGMEEIVAEEEEMEKGRNEDKRNMTMKLSQLRTLRILDLPNLKIISSRVLICNALETIIIDKCRHLKKLPFCIHNLPSALKQIKDSSSQSFATCMPVRRDHSSIRTRSEFASTEDHTSIIGSSFLSCFTLFSNIYAQIALERIAEFSSYSD
ncbi:putative disease resistance protein isoform X1 [Cinnamomum micranthum f. kanehirae]|uniref:Putative disease resistance protein isoform X1 n=1 Tax=Cinnamomum micranthum f. kanehirae TaxID=337451 RepID=A0A3S3N4G1_9MAGN|nr:putative disease resistance protein isoform X1 [Cinnamomum micranthum f. kanehirae]